MIKRKLPSTNFVFASQIRIIKKKKKKKEKSDIVVGHNLVPF